MPKVYTLVQLLRSVGENLPRMLVGSIPCSCVARRIEAERQRKRGRETRSPGCTCIILSEKDESMIHCSGASAEQFRLADHKAQAKVRCVSKAEEGEGVGEPDIHGVSSGDVWFKSEQKEFEASSFRVCGGVPSNHRFEGRTFHGPCLCASLLRILPS